MLQLEHDGLYLTDDRNTAVFPNSQGMFDPHELFCGGHYEVHGNGTANEQAPASLGTATSGLTGGSGYHFFQRPLPPSTASSVTPAFRRPATAPKTFQRLVMS